MNIFYRKHAKKQIEAASRIDNRRAIAGMKEQKILSTGLLASDHTFICNPQISQLIEQISELPYNYKHDFKMIKARNEIAEKVRK